MTHQANQIVPKLASELRKLTPGKGNNDPASSQQLEFTCVWLSLWGPRPDCSCCLRADVCRLGSAAPGSCRTCRWCDLQLTVIGCDWWPLTLETRHQQLASPSPHLDTHSPTCHHTTVTPSASMIRQFLLEELTFLFSHKMSSTECNAPPRVL